MGFEYGVECTWDSNTLNHNMGTVVEGESKKWPMRGAVVQCSEAHTALFWADGER